MEHVPCECWLSMEPESVCLQLEAGLNEVQREGEEHGEDAVRLVSLTAARASRHMLP